MEGSWWSVDDGLMKQLCTTFQTFTNVLKSMPSDLLSKLARLKNQPPSFKAAVNYKSYPHIK